MAGRFGAVSRSLISTARSSSFLRSPPAAPSAPRIRSPFRRGGVSFAPPRTFGELGCTQSLLPFASAPAIPRLTAHLAADVRAFCELYNGTFCRTCQDR